MSNGSQLFKITPSNHESQTVQEVDFSQIGIQERKDIQEWIVANPDILGEELLIIGKEFSGFDRTNERADLLAIDFDGKLVVIELKRDDTGTNVHWQAIKYASYLHHANAEDIIRMLADHEGITEADAANKIRHHTDDDTLENINKDQRIILASHRFAPEATSAALWLNQQTPNENLITCIQLIPYQDTDTDSLYIQTSTIIPVPGTDEYTIRVGDTQYKQQESRSSARRRNDDITRFMEKMGGIVLDELNEEIRPDKKSWWAGLHDDKSTRYYHMWYSRKPWSNWGFSYQVDLYPRQDTPYPNLFENADPDCSWMAKIKFTCNPNKEGRLHHISKTDTDELIDAVVNLEVHEDQQDQQEETGDRYGDLIAVSHFARDLDDDFARQVADTLTLFIERITPEIRDFEN